MTRNAYLVRISLAQKINRICGGAVIAPWEVGALSDDWLDAFRAYYGQQVTGQQEQAKVTSIKQDWLARFKHYRN